MWRQVTRSGAGVNPSRTQTSLAILPVFSARYSAIVDCSPQTSRSKTQLSQSWKTALLAADQTHIQTASTPPRRRDLSVQRRLLLLAATRAFVIVVAPASARAQRDMTRRRHVDA